jgi:hypothetical protein
LGLTQEGFSPAALRLAVRQAAKAPSFKEASEDLRELAGLAISPAHLDRLAQRVGTGWAVTRNQDVEAFRQGRLGAVPAAAPAVAAVMLDGGKLQTRAEGAGRGAHEPAWRETKVACCLTLQSKERAVDPEPQPPKGLLEQPRVARLAAEIRARGTGGGARAGRPDGRRRRRRRARRTRPVKLVRTVVATLADSEAFGWQMAAEVQRRRLGEARRKACVCDGQRYNWALFALHLLPLGFVAVLDIIHLVGWLYAAAQAAAGSDKAAAWALYACWLRLAWSGQVKPLLARLRAQAARRGQPPPGAKEDDPRQVLQDAVGYVFNNRDKMDYPEYRRLGLPISSAPVESTIKQVNRRVKGTEKFWLEGGAEAVLQLRAAYLSEDDRAQRYWVRPRPRGRAVGGGRLGRRR